MPGGIKLKAVPPREGAGWGQWHMALLAAQEKALAALEDISSYLIC